MSRRRVPRYCRGEHVPTNIGDGSAGKTQKEGLRSGWETKFLMGKHGSHPFRGCPQGGPDQTKESMFWCGKSISRLSRQETRGGGGLRRITFQRYAPGFETQGEKRRSHLSGNVKLGLAESPGTTSLGKASRRKISTPTEGRERGARSKGKVWGLYKLLTGGSQRHSYNEGSGHGEKKELLGGKKREPISRHDNGIAINKIKEPKKPQRWNIENQKSRHKTIREKRKPRLESEPIQPEGKKRSKKYNIASRA